MAVQRDRRGCVKRECKKRLNPMKHYRKAQFEARYRLTKRLVKKMVKRFKPHNSTKGSKQGGGISHEEKFSLALRYFATGGSFYLVGDTQHVSKALVSRAVRDVSEYFYRNQSKYIHWPATFNQKNRLAKDFFLHKDAKKPSVFALVDGTHIPLLTPKINESCYVNKSSYHSINTTIICDYNRRIVHCDPRWPGSVNDAYCFKSSKVGDMCKSEKLGDFVMLADSGYALQRNLFTPYEKPETDKQKAYNKWHRSNRARVEQCIGLLKQRFRCLDSAGGYLHHTPERAAKIIVTCACLHNIAVDNGLKVEVVEDDPWVPRSLVRLPQPDQPRRSRESRQEDYSYRKRFRDSYVLKHF